MTTATRTTFTRETKLADRSTLTATVKLERYLSVTGEIRFPRRREPSSCGMLHDDIRKAWPDLEALIQWHLTDADGTPMHYIANGLYWWEIAVGLKSNTPHGPDPVEAFKRTVIWGRLPTDADSAPWTWATTAKIPGERGEVAALLRARLPALQAAFREDCARFGLAVGENVTAAVRQDEPGKGTVLAVGPDIAAVRAQLPTGHQTPAVAFWRVPAGTAVGSTVILP